MSPMAANRFAPSSGEPRRRQPGRLGLDRDHRDVVRDDVVQLARDAGPLLHDHLVALRLGHCVPRRVPLGDRLAALPARVAQDLRADREHQQEEALERALLARGRERGDEERQHEQHRPAAPVAVGDQIEHQKLGEEAREREHRRGAHERDDGGEGDDPGHPGQARAPEDERKRRQEGGNHSGRPVVGPARVDEGLHQGAEAERESEEDGPSGPSRARRARATRSSIIGCTGPLSRSSGPAASPRIRRFLVTREGDGRSPAHRCERGERRLPGATRWAPSRRTVEAMERNRRGTRSDQAIRRHARRRRPLVRGAARPRDRLRRPQRRGQVDHAASDSRAGRSQRRKRARERPAVRRSRQPAPRGRGAARRPRDAPRAFRPRPPALARREQRAVTHAGGRGARARRAGGRGPPEGRRLLARHGAAPRPRGRASRRSAHPAPRRAGQRPRPGGDSLDPRAAQVARVGGPRGARVQPPHDRARGHCRPPHRHRARAAPRRRQRERPAGRGGGRACHRPHAGGGAR